jgi:2-polyprenyl-3-methyl-5-hydroxy-6-metoxy-1,4-benzoquinol methylase
VVNDQVLTDALDYFGSVSGKTIIEVGCGDGAYSLAFAARGAQVIALDFSEKAVENLRAAATAGHTPLTAVCADVFKLADYGPVDFIFGSMILHHLEPFEEFAIALRRALKPGGRAFFYENNAASRLLIWFRTNIVGKLWVPKYGDDQEFPLMPQEVDILRKQFQVSVVYPEMFFFRLISGYLLGEHFLKFFKAIDKFCYKRGWFLRFSYRQYVRLLG